MGSDFIEKSTPSFKKSWDRAKVALATADLFTTTPDCNVRAAEAEIIEGASLEVGDQLTIEAQGTRLVARKGNSEVALMPDPPLAIHQAVVDSCGIAKGTVEHIHPIAGVVEVSLC